MHLGMAECRIPFWVIVTLTSDLVYRIIVSGESHPLFERARDPKFGVWLHLWMTECHVVNVF